MWKCRADSLCKSVRASQLGLYDIQGLTTGLEEYMDQTHAAYTPEAKGMLVRFLSSLWGHAGPTF